METQVPQLMTPTSTTIAAKRTNKRPRTPSTPLGPMVSSDDSTGQTTTSSATSSTEELVHVVVQATDEEQDMANCLILLAQGTTTTTTTTATATTTTTTATTTTAGSYECKTCNRCFSSFQALGGHRASHKKPKLLLGLMSSPVAEDKRATKAPPLLLESSSIDQIPALSLQIAIATSTTDNNNYHNNNLSRSSRAHDCGVCGARFVSGQALGGHMRRHRVVPVVGGRGLGLDLNLPAPDDDDDEQRKYVFGSNEKSLIFSSTSLVDCHY